MNMSCKRCGTPMDTTWWVATKGYCYTCKMNNGGIRGIAAGFFSKLLKTILARGVDIV